jgi:hypothetical protein
MKRKEIAHSSKDESDNLDEQLADVDLVERSDLMGKVGWMRHTDWGRKYYK